MEEAVDLAARLIYVGASSFAASLGVLAAYAAAHTMYPQVREAGAQLFQSLLSALLLGSLLAALAQGWSA